MQAKKKRLTLDIDAAVHQRLKAAAVLKDVSMRQYCETAIERELDKDEAEERRPKGFNYSWLAAKREEILGNRKFSGDSTEYIRQARESRNIC